MSAVLMFFPPKYADKLGEDGPGIYLSLVLESPFSLAVDVSLLQTRKERTLSLYVHLHLARNG
jgi:hypothetical protein